MALGNIITPTYYLEHTIFTARNQIWQIILIWAYLYIFCGPTSPSMIMYVHIRKLSQN